MKSDYENRIKERISWLEGYGRSVFSTQYIKDVCDELRNVLKDE